MKEVGSTGARGIRIRERESESSSTLRLWLVYREWPTTHNLPTKSHYPLCIDFYPSPHHRHLPTAHPLHPRCSLMASSLPNAPRPNDCRGQPRHGFLKVFQCQTCHHENLFYGDHPGAYSYPTVCPRCRRIYEYDDDVVSSEYTLCVMSFYELCWRCWACDWMLPVQSGWDECSGCSMVMDGSCLLVWVNPELREYNRGPWDYDIYDE